MKDGGLFGPYYILKLIHAKDTQPGDAPSTPGGYGGPEDEKAA